MLQSIYSCKLYRSSSRKKAIKAALESPLNLELVQQMAEALDENYQDPDLLVKDYDHIDVDSPEEGAETAPEGEDVSTEDAGPGPISHPSHSAPPSGGPDMGESSDSPLESEDNSEDSPTEEPKPPVEESTSVKGQPVTASTEQSCSTTSEIDFKQTCEEVKGLLNLRDDCKGVNRVTTKEQELWIYYSDDVNLNNIMWNVIDILMNSGYTYLCFNRLARSDNAIVFQIDVNGTVVPVEKKDEKK